MKKIAMCLMSLIFTLTGLTSCAIQSSVASTESNSEVVPEVAHNYDGICTTCGVYDTQGVVYTYDAEQDCYYVSDMPTDADLIVKTNGDVVVHILSKYNDGINGEKNVSYLGAECFCDNVKAQAVTHLMLPESVTSLKHKCCSNMTNLKYVAMLGVTEFCDENNTDQFLNCTKLETLIIKSKLKIRQPAFRDSTGEVKDITTIYAFDSGAISILGLKSTNAFLVGAYALFYNITGKEGTWKYAEDGYNIIAS